jgi:hypothetical protein
MIRKPLENFTQILKIVYIISTQQKNPSASLSPPRDF